MDHPGDYRNFSCSNNHLIPLEEIPKKIIGQFKCDNFETNSKNLNQSKCILDNIKKYPILETLFTAGIVQEMVDKDPNQAVVLLKDVWNKLKNEKGFDKLVFPKGTREILDNLGGLEEFGL